MLMCKICFKDIKVNSINSLRKDLCICDSCFKLFNPRFIEIKIQNIPTLIIYNYDEVIKEKLFLLKGCYDIELGPIFLNRFLFELRLKYRGYILVCLPSSKEDDELRGFNHVEEIFKVLKLPIVHILYKKFKFKQSDLNKEERNKIKSKLGYKDLHLITNKKVLIVDDVLTTGSSINAAIDLVKLGHPKRIKILILSKRINPKIKPSFSIKSLMK